MQLLVSVGNRIEAEAAVSGGADLIDAKDPMAGPLGPVSLETLGTIHTAVARRRPVTAALGDAAEEAAIEYAAHTFAETGVAFLKVGFAGISSARFARALSIATARGAKTGNAQSKVVAVAYADAERVGSLPPAELVGVAIDAGMDGVLIDTADKNGPGLRGLVEPATLAGWVALAHGAGLFVALAGKLTADDIESVCATGADIIGVRGAACAGGRNGNVTAGRVRLLRERCDPVLERAEFLT